MLVHLPDCPCHPAQSQLRRQRSSSASIDGDGNLFQPEHPRPSGVCTCRGVSRSTRGPTSLSAVSHSIDDGGASRHPITSTDFTVQVELSKHSPQVSSPALSIKPVSVLKFVPRNVTQNANGRVMDCNNDYAVYLSTGPSRYLRFVFTSLMLPHQSTIPGKIAFASRSDGRPFELIDVALDRKRGKYLLTADSSGRVAMFKLPETPDLAVLKFIELHFPEDDRLGPPVRVLWHPLEPDVFVTIHRAGFVAWSVPKLKNLLVSTGARVPQESSENSVDGEPAILVNVPNIYELCGSRILFSSTVALDESDDQNDRRRSVEGEILESSGERQAPSDAAFAPSSSLLIIALEPNILSFWRLSSSQRSSQPKINLVFLTVLNGVSRINSVGVCGPSRRPEPLPTPVIDHRVPTDVPSFSWLIVGHDNNLSLSVFILTAHSHQPIGREIQILRFRPKSQTSSSDHFGTSNDFGGLHGLISVDSMGPYLTVAVSGRVPHDDSADGNTDDQIRAYRLGTGVLYLVETNSTADVVAIAEGAAGGTLRETPLLSWLPLRSIRAIPLGHPISALKSINVESGKLLNNNKLLLLGLITQGKMLTTDEISKFANAKPADGTSVPAVGLQVSILTATDVQLRSDAEALLELAAASEIESIEFARLGRRPATNDMHTASGPEPGAGDFDESSLFWRVPVKALDASRKWDESPNSPNSLSAFYQPTSPKVADVPMEEKSTTNKIEVGSTAVEVAGESLVNRKVPKLRIAKAPVRSMQVDVPKPPAPQLGSTTPAKVPMQTAGRGAFEDPVGESQLGESPVGDGGSGVSVEMKDILNKLAGVMVAELRRVESRLGTVLRTDQTEKLQEALDSAIPRMVTSVVEKAEVSVESLVNRAVSAVSQKIQKSLPTPKRRVPSEPSDRELNEESNRLQMENFVNIIRQEIKSTEDSNSAMNVSIDSSLRSMEDRLDTLIAFDRQFLSSIQNEFREINLNITNLTAQLTRIENQNATDPSWSALPTSILGPSRPNFLKSRGAYPPSPTESSRASIDHKSDRQRTSDAITAGDYDLAFCLSMAYDQRTGENLLLDVCRKFNPVSWLGRPSQSPLSHPVLLGIAKSLADSFATTNEPPPSLEECDFRLTWIRECLMLIDLQDKTVCRANVGQFLGEMSTALLSMESDMQTQRSTLGRGLTEKIHQIVGLLRRLNFEWQRCSKNSISVSHSESNHDIPSPARFDDSAFRWTTNDRLLL